MSGRREVQLLGVPFHQQGDADGLCVYYAMTMLVAALRPELLPTIHETPKARRGSPVFLAFRDLAEEKDASFGSKFARWFFEGMTSSEARDVLNRVFWRLQGRGERRRWFVKRIVNARRATRFKRNPERRALLRRWNVSDVLATLDEHLPVMVGGGGVGDHEVLLVGYSHESPGERYVCYHDPRTGHVEWMHTTEMFYEAEVIVPVSDMFPRYRPNKLVTVDGATELIPWPP